uniref:Uncharacterized protein n=1 Tax=Anguilla anguilla TaxID=7936 RepID=A0A0E9SNX4_ANGAN
MEVYLQIKAVNTNLARWITENINKN